MATCGASSRNWALVGMETNMTIIDRRRLLLLGHGLAGSLLAPPILVGTAWGQGLEDEDDDPGYDLEMPPGALRACQSRPPGLWLTRNICRLLARREQQVRACRGEPDMD